MKAFRDEPSRGGSAHPVDHRRFAVVPECRTSFTGSRAPAGGTKHGSVLVIHGNRRIAKYLDGVLRNGFRVRTLTSWDDTPASLREAPPDAILCDAESLGEGIDGLLDLPGNDNSMRDIPLILLLNDRSEDLSETRKLLPIAADCVSPSIDPLVLKWKVMKVISQKREVEDLRSRELESRKQADRCESLTHMMAHDLKSSVIAMNGFLRRLKVRLEETSVGSDTKWILDRVSSSSQFMEDFLGDMNELLSSDGMSTTRTPIRLDEIATEVIVQHKALQADKEVYIQLHAQEDLPRAMGNRSRIKQVFDNLLGNALRHMGSVRNPKIFISIERRGDLLEASVADNGVGIPADYQERIFDPFTRGPDAARKKGSGLGLSIVKQIVTRHNGKIWLESESGSGARFVFTLPTCSAEV